MSPIPAGLELTLGNSGQDYFDLNFALQLRGYLPPDWIAMDSDGGMKYTFDSRTALEDFLKDREQEFTGLGEYLSGNAAEAFGRSWCAQRGIPTWLQQKVDHDPQYQKNIYTVPTSHWENKNITYRLKKNSHWPTGHEQDIEAAIDLAFSWWTQSGIDLTFEKVSDDTTTTPVVIDISFWSASSHGDEISFEINPNYKFALAHAYYPIEQLEGKFACDIHFNETDPTIWKFDGTEYDLATMAAHEIGHALGLGHSKSQLSIMYPDYISRHQKVPDFDLLDLKNLYEKGETKVITYHAVTGPGGGGPRPTVGPG